MLNNCTIQATRDLPQDWSCRKDTVVLEISKLIAYSLKDKSLVCDSGWLGSAGSAVVVVEGARVAPGPARWQHPGHGRRRSEQQAGRRQHYQLGV